MSNPKTSEIDLPKFAGLLARKRAGRTLRVLAGEIGEVSASTLSRIEKGNVPDLDTFVRICRWLGCSPQDFLSNTSHPLPPHGGSTHDVVCAHLRADRTLPPETAKALVTMIQLAYKDITDGNLDEADAEP
jgi:transcriptional regulator with XRE-family HTH domain